jgi:Ca2+-binding EF-hand superfamily protein
LEADWALLSDKGTLSIKDFQGLFDQAMPRLVDREVALEVFQQLDADRDGKLTFKDFRDAMLFEL